MEDETLRSREEEDDDDASSLDGNTLLPSTSAAPTTSTSAAEEKEAQEIAAMKARVAEMEKEAAVLRQMTAQAEANQRSGGAGGAGSQEVTMSDEEKEAIDQRSIYVGNVDYASTPEEIQSHFSSCGTINRVTILFDKYTGPKGYAYVEFADPSLVANAVMLNESMFRGRLLKVTPKRTNVPGLGAARGRGRGRGGYRGGGGFRGGGFSPYSRPRGRGGYRGRGGF